MATKRWSGRGRDLSTTFLLEIGEAAWLIAIYEGKIVSVRQATFFVMPSSSLPCARRKRSGGNSESPAAARCNDLMALIKRRVLKADGNPQIFMANLALLGRGARQAAGKPAGAGT